VLTIDSNPLDFVRFPEHLRLIENRIREALNLSPYQAELRLNNESRMQISREALIRIAKENRRKKAPFRTPIWWPPT